MQIKAIWPVVHVYAQTPRQVLLFGKAIVIKQLDWSIISITVSPATFPAISYFDIWKKTISGNV